MESEKKTREILMVRVLLGLGVAEDSAEEESDYGLAAAQDKEEGRRRKQKKRK